MASSAAQDPVATSTPLSKNAKKKKKKAAKDKVDSAAIAEEKTNGVDAEGNSDVGEQEAEPEQTAPEAEAEPAVEQPTHSRKSSQAVNGTTDEVTSGVGNLKVEETPTESDITLNGHTKPAVSEETEARLEALAQERTALRDEVAQLRKSLEELQGKHEEELSGLRTELEETQGEKEHADTQYRNLLGRVNTIRSQLGEKLKSDAEELSKAREKIEELEEANASLEKEKNTQASEIKQLRQDEEEHSKELSTIRNRLNLSSQNWAKEREELMGKEAFVEKELEQAKQAMQEWEVLAMEERSIREHLAEKAADMEQEVTSLREGNQSLESERNTQRLNIDGLQRALRELQEARKTELRELVENSQTQVQKLQTELKDAQETTASSSKELENAQRELNRLSPIENEVKEKNLLIMKLRHEAVILNDHLTKALKQLKKGKPDDTVDRQLMTNHFLQFLNLDRSDPKKFQVLQIISSLLNWTEEQRESAGLSRPGTSNPSLRTPISPWHRTPSTPSLSTDFLSPQPTPQTGTSLGGMWSEFLETESNRGGRGSRSTSVSSSRR